MKRHDPVAAGLKTREVLGVPSHPEYILREAEQRLLFQWLVARAERRLSFETTVVKRYAS